ERIQAGRQDVAEKAEGAAALDHHRDAEFWSPGREDKVGRGSKRASDQDRKSRLPEAQAEYRDSEDSDKDCRELEVRRQPGPEEVDGFAMALLERYVLDATRLDGGDPLSVVTLA